MLMRNEPVPELEDKFAMTCSSVNRVSAFDRVLDRELTFSTTPLEQKVERTAMS